MSDRERPTRRDNKPQTTPDPARPELFQFIERLFEPDQWPEKIELRQAFGPGARRLGDSAIMQKEFKTNGARPTREQMVAISNEFLDVAQTDCNELEKPHRYRILAKNHTKGDKFYSSHLIKMRPTQPGSYDPNDPESIDDEEITSDGKHRDALVRHALDHLRQSDENERWRQDQYSTSTGDILSHYKELTSMLMNQNMEMLKEHRELFKTADEALSKKTERDMAMKMQDFKIGAMQHAGLFLKQMFPVVVNQLTSKTTIPTDLSAESIAVKSFIDGLSDAQAKSLLGDLDENRHLIGNGIFSMEQVQTFVDIARCVKPPSALDKFIEGGELAITQDQIMKAQSVLTPEQFMPLVALVMSRSSQRQPASPPPATISSPTV